MLRLDATTRKLQVLLGGAVTTNELPIMACYSDKTASTYAGAAVVAATTGTTPVDAVPAPGASTVRDVDYFSVRNADTVSATVTIRHDDSGTPTDFAKASLDAGDTLTYTHAKGWHTLDSTGALKSTGSGGSTVNLTGPITSVGAATSVAAQTGTGSTFVMDTSPTLTTPRIASGSSINDSNGNELLKVPAAVASAVNEITLSNAATGNNPSLTASGSDTNIGLNLVPKGSGAVQANGVPVVTTTGTQTLTNKTLTAPVIGDTVSVGTAAGTTGAVNLKGTTSGTITLTVADAAGTWTIKLPTADGTNGQVIQTNGAGQLSFVTPSAGGSESAANNVLRYERFY